MRRRVFDADHDQFRAAVGEFVSRSIRPHHEAFIDARGFGREVWREAGEHGFLGLDVPEAYGGVAVDDQRFNAVLVEELAGVAAAFASCFGIHVNVVIPYLVELGTPAMKERWLPAVASGAAVTAMAMTEPSGGSDLAALRTTAVPDGTDWLVSGSKTFITNGWSADLAVVEARTSPSVKARGITLFAVDTTIPGFTRGRKLDKVGQPESDTAELFLDRVRVPADHVLGEVDRGFAHMMERLPRERLSDALANTAHARQILGETIEHARERHAFGHAIGSLQHNKFLIAELVTKLDVLGAFVDTCLQAHLDGELSSVDAAKAKWWAAQTQNEVLDACVQLHGGYGYMREYRVARAWTDARVTKIWAGSNEVMKEIIGRGLGF